MNQLINGVLTAGLSITLSMSSAPFSGAQLASPEPFVTPLDMHPVDPMYTQVAKPVMMGLPSIVRPGAAVSPDPRQIQVPAGQTPSQPEGDAPGTIIGKAGTGFFVAADGTLLTAAHVVKECSRMQVISKYLPRTWASLGAVDQIHDIAILKAVGIRPPAVVRVAESAPVSARLFILGYPSSAGLTTPAETWAVVENDKFPSTIGPLANPRELLWMSAPGVEHGYSGGPIFDPKLGAVVGIVKGEVEGGYLRLVRDMPTTGIAIGPGVGHIGALLHREVPYAAVSLVSSPGETGEDTLRRATVHVLCWR